jgi:hypothetical protein
MNFLKVFWIRQIVKRYVKSQWSQQLKSKVRGNIPDWLVLNLVDNLCKLELYMVSWWFDHFTYKIAQTVPQIHLNVLSSYKYDRYCSQNWTSIWWMSINYWLHEYWFLPKSLVFLNYLELLQKLAIQWLAK